MVYVQPPGDFEIGAMAGRRDAPADVPFPGALNDWIDTQVLGPHLYGPRPDPEGILSTFPAVATVLLGVLCGTWLHQARSNKEKAVGMLIASVPLILLGLLWGFAFPIKKKIWTSSFVVYTAGWGLFFFGLCYYANDVLNWRRWSKPLVIFGTNPILIFFGSGIMSRMLSMTRWEGEERLWTLRSWFYVNGFESWLGPGKNASLAFAFCFVVLWLILTYPLYRKKIFLKV